MTEKSADYRELIRFELERRCRGNPRYSLRAFARDLGLVPSRVSGVLNRRQGLSREKAAKIAEKLGLTPAEQLLFCDRVESEHARSTAKKDLARKRLKTRSAMLSYANISLDSFRMISGWHHLAILEALRLVDFMSSPGWLSARLGVTLNEAKAAVTRLVRLGMLETSNEAWAPSRRSNATPTDIPSEAIRDFHQQILDKARAALQEHPVAERDFSSMLLAFPSSRLAEAKADLKEFRRIFSAKYDPEKGCDEVYCLSIQFFRLTRKLKGDSPC